MKVVAIVGWENIEIHKGSSHIREFCEARDASEKFTAVLVPKWFQISKYVSSFLKPVCGRVSNT